MLNMKKIVIAFLTLAFLAGANVAQAKEPIVAIGIAGPGIKHELILQDRRDLNRFADGWWWLIGFRYGNDAAPQPMVAPLKVSGPAYTITRYTQTSAGRIAFDQMRYYPGAGAKGVTFFVGGVMQGYSTDFDGKWFRSTEAGDAVVRDVFARYRISVPVLKHVTAKE